MEYMVLSDFGSNRLAELVNNAISDGWEPQGGFCYAPTQTYANGGGDRIEGRFYQAMIKRKK